MDAKAIIESIFYVTNVNNYTAPHLGENCFKFTQEILDDPHDMIIYPFVTFEHIFQIKRVICTNPKITNKILGGFNLLVYEKRFKELTNPEKIMKFQEKLKTKVLKAFLTILGFNRIYLNKILIPNNIQY